MFFRAAAADPVVARALGEVSSREHSPLRLLDPRLAPRVWRHALTRPRSSRPVEPARQLPERGQ